jgi:hypothetical protein
VRLEDLRQFRPAARKGRQALPRRAHLQRIEWTARLSQVVTGDVHVSLRRSQAAMAEQCLDRPHVHPGFQQMSRKTVA